MRKLILLLLLLPYSHAFSQINVGSYERVTKKPGEFTKESLKALKNTTTYFVYRESDNENLDALKSAIESAWTYTPIEIISYPEFLKGGQSFNNSYFTIAAYHVTAKSSSGMETDYTSIYLKLWMKDRDRNEQVFCKMELFPDFTTVGKTDITAMGSKKQVNKKTPMLLNYYYTQAVFHNWNIPNLKNGLQLVNQYLTNSETRWIGMSDNTSEITSLKNDTLHIPDYVLIKFSAFTGGENNRHDIEELMSKYPYPYKLISTDDLTEKIQNSNKPIYYLTYVRSTTDKFVTITNSQTGEIIYSDYTPVSYNIKDKDFNKIAKVLK